MVGVLLGIALGEASLAVDRGIDRAPSDLPLGLASTVASARALLSTVAGATITFAGIAFSISLLTIQLASSQYSPRVVHTLFRDPFNRRVMALVVGTFTYCVVVLRAVRSALEDGAEPLVPHLSVTLSVALGIITILAIVAFIDHSAHAMDVSEILEDVRRDATAQIHREWGPAGEAAATTPAPYEVDGPGHAIAFDTAGWVQAIDQERLLQALPPWSTLRLDTFPGRYALPGAPLGTLFPPPDDEAAVDRRARAALAIGDTRTTQQDVSYGLRQLVDVALKALSPGINDPTTAQDAIFHAAAVLGDLLRCDPPPTTATAPDGRCLLLPQQPTLEELVALTFDEVRRAAAPHPTVCVYLLEALHLLVEVVAASGLPARAAPLEAQAELVVAGAEMADLLPADLELVRLAHAKRFGPS